MKHEIRISGLGGQGILLAGYILGKASTIYDGKNAVQTESYGPEARGSRSKTDIIISDDEIDYPYITSNNILVALSQDAYNYYKTYVCKGGIIIVDEDLVEITGSREDVKIYKIPATRIATSIGRKIVANIVVLGALCAITGVITYEALEKAVLDSVPKGSEEINLRALREGYNYGKNLLTNSKF
ncbi:MAG: 2-oxoacid:ferredoxin oxidoreductase subunit gamma [Candidatus Methanomethylicia archaeon]|nr:2-oxoacid:ferredoxin oxidoreductase subunit gamma [Candidatus Methanomethylicia archaeon]MCX8169261.1 2-oxoacid:ferredoxin oxidoreductase subunit gamma [Candidatus Methanomethylicia archaeon]MDW7988957.1 2-oxoacid:ferredoxin oxidoreductase subunit gamma [Nitrososphaerota archaeon]